MQAVQPKLQHSKLKAGLQGATILDASCRVLSWVVANLRPVHGGARPSKKEGNITMPKVFCVYGDNIVECERMINLIANALAPFSIRTFGSPTNPQYEFTTERIRFTVKTFPGFGRWEYDIIKYIRENGGVLREAPDIILTEANNGRETPILAVEFCNALPAGNQAWQRSGRAYSTAKSGIPYIFITETGGYELDSKRNKKAPRMPNPAVPFSYLSYALMSNSEISIAYQMNPGADSSNKARYAKSVCDNDFTTYLRAFFIGGNRAKGFRSLQTHLMDFVNLLAEKDRSGHLRANDWKAIFDDLRNSHSNTTITRSDFAWRKKISIPTTRTFASIFKTGQKLCHGLASCNLPFAVLPKGKIAQFFAALKHNYGHKAEKFASLLHLDSDLIVCWYAGFKPRGDDARPDRGVLPFVRMLVGDDLPVMTFLYGPATKPMAHLLEIAPDALLQANGLWEATVSLSDYIVCDSGRAKSPVLQLGRMKVIRNKKKSTTISMPANTNKAPSADLIGENDVDSTLHLLFTCTLAEKCHELMCNPPGGDWSGVSMLQHGIEYRWLTLPRVSAAGFKRPDHVVQIGDDLILSVESKDYLRNLEKNIGVRLNGYCRTLFATPPSCKRMSGISEWDDETANFNPPQMRYASAAAFLAKTDGDLFASLKSARTDMSIAMTFSEKGMPLLKIAFAKTAPQELRELFSAINPYGDLKMQIQLL